MMRNTTASFAGEVQQVLLTLVKISYNSVLLNYPIITPKCFGFIIV